jgi:thioredoxin reductase
VTEQPFAIGTRVVARRGQWAGCEGRIVDQRTENEEVKVGDFDAGRGYIRNRRYGVVLDGYEPGGQLALTTMVENFPGFPDGILGPELIENSRKQAQRFGTEFQSGAVTSVDLSRRPFTVIAGKETYETETLIVAAGASARMLGIESERHLLGHGVSTCATCDGFFFRGKDIIVSAAGTPRWKKPPSLRNLRGR